MEKYLVSFKSGHYKSFTGEWLGDSVWMHFKKDNGEVIHVNKNEVEYVSHKPLEEKKKERLDEGQGC